MSDQRPSGPGAEAAPGQADPSMEDILASIRRILSEDESPPAEAAPKGAAEPEPKPRPEPEPEPLDLTEDMMVSPPPAPAPEPPPSEPVAEPATASAGPLPVADAAAPARTATDPALLAPAAAMAAAASVGALLRAVADNRSANVTRSGPSIEDVVREELRPLLKEWLDSHLPGLVERLVRAEIERVVGRALS